MNGRDVWHYLSVARHSGFVAVSALPANWRQSPLQHAALDAVCAGIFCPYSGRTGIIFPRLESMTKKKNSIEPEELRRPVEKTKWETGTAREKEKEKQSKREARQAEARQGDEAAH